MDTTQIIMRARELGVKLELDGDDIVATPASRLTAELRAGIQEQKLQIVRDLLLRDALAYLAERSGGEALSEELIPLENQVNAAYADEDMAEFRAAIREYVKAALRIFRAREGRAA